MVTVLRFSACGADVDLTTQCLGPALFNCMHRLAVAGEDLVSVFLAVGRAVLVKDIGQF
jgi:hypothetical protein